MKILVLALFVGLAANAQDQNYVYANYSSYLSQSYESRVSIQQLLNSPPWIDSALDPPLSPRNAQNIATAYLVELFKGKWTVGGIALVPLRDDRWAYVISFDPPAPEHVGEFVSSPFKIVVLMEGTVVPPERSKN
jgi:hypothetical protein